MQNRRQIAAGIFTAARVVRIIFFSSDGKLNCLGQAYNLPARSLRELTNGDGAACSRASSPASNGKVFAQRPARIRRAEAATALQLRHQKIDDVVEHLDLLGLGMAQHEAAAASRAFEAFFKIVGDLGRSAG